MDQAAGPPDLDVPQPDDSPHDEPDDVTVRLLHELDDVRMVSEVFQQIWGTPRPIIGAELMRAIAHAGGYVVGAYEHDGGSPRMVGASVGFRGEHEGATSLHSHITGLLAGARSLGIGRKIKQHQRQWCAEHSIDWITWTFDPLMRRNAWFNIEILGARMSEYLLDFYGPLEDAVNRDDASDRLLVAWSVTEDASVPDVPDTWTESRVPTPENVVELRRTDPVASNQWRLRVRNELGEPMSAGAVVTGFDRDGNYVLRHPA